MNKESYSQGYIDAVQEIDEVLTRSATRIEDIRTGTIAVLNDVTARLHYMNTRDFDEENESKEQTKSVDEALERIARIIFEQL